MNKKDKNDTGAVILFFIIVIGIVIFQRDSQRQQKREELSSKIFELENELERLQNRIDELDSFSYNISSDNSYWYSVDEELLDSVYYVIDDTIAENERKEAIDTLAHIVGDSSIEDYIYYIDYDEIPFIGEEATYEAYNLAEEIYDVINN